ncbi:hypothetical protein BsIDN1_22840 [Bacillus safensis]|uniref:PTS EIIB type-2 domain-containing protein n=1 Tax=Bacillus safensis TaxID=561879 RepID=A0A5S9MAU9_BACIA|nr:hypothetical protein BsIDN1_22840 [Bacillus safensis]
MMSWWNSVRHLKSRKKAEGADLIVTTTPVSDTKGTPVIQTLSFLTGFGIEDDIEKIIDHIK